MSNWNSQEVMDYLSSLLQNFNGREYSGPIDRETLFFSELGMMSIDAVVLGETLESHYGKKDRVNIIVIPCKGAAFQEDVGEDKKD